MTPEQEIVGSEEPRLTQKVLLDELHALLIQREALCQRITDVERQARKLKNERNALAVRANRLQSRILKLREHLPHGHGIEPCQG